MKINFRMKMTGLVGSVLMTAMVFSSCSKSSDSNSNDGKTDPSSIATANLVAYFPFNGNGKDTIATITPKASPGVTYVAGKRGLAYQGADAAYFLYDLPAASKLKSLKAFTIAMWFYGTPAVEGVVPVPGILQISGTGDQTWGNLSLSQERMPDVADSLNMHIQFYDDSAVWSHQHVIFSHPSIIENKWLHIVYDYDATTSTFAVYVNGAILSFIPASTADGIATRWADGDNVSPRPLLYTLAFKDATQLAVGGWIQKILGASTDEWMGYFKGKMDELRIYDKGLSATEVKALYDAEVTQLQ